MIKFERSNIGVFATQYSIYEDNIYIGECIGYAQPLCTNEFNYVLTWCFYIEPKGDLTEFIQHYESTLTDDIDELLKSEYEKYSMWDHRTRVIVKGKVIEVEDIGENF